MYPWHYEGQIECELRGFQSNGFSEIQIGEQEANHKHRNHLICVVGLN